MGRACVSRLHVQPRRNLATTSRRRASYGAKRSQAFWWLHARLTEVQAELAHRMGVKLAEGFEAAFVLYPSGGFYRKHLDSAPEPLVER